MVLKLRISQTKNYLKNYTNQVIRKFEEKKIHSPFIDNIWGAYLADMQLIIKFNKGIHFLLCVVDIFTK